MPFKIRLIDRYVFMLFARVFVLCFACLTGIYIIGDFVNNLTEFIEIGKARGGMLPVMVAYYGVRAPLFFDTMGRVVALISAVFAISWLQRHNEMSALMAAGISRWRIIKPLVVGVVAIAILAVLNRELVLPRFRESLSQRAQDLVAERAQTLHARYDRLTNILIDGAESFPQKQLIRKAKFHMPQELSAFGLHIASERAIRRSATDKHPAGFLMVNVTSPANVDEINSVVRDQPIIMTRKDYDWLPPGQCFVASNVSLNQLVGNRSWRQYATTANLIKALHNPSLNLGNDVPLTIHSRILQPVLDVALFFLGVPVVLSRESRNVFVSIGSCLLVVVIFFAVITGAQSLGLNYILSPSLAAWIPVMIFVPWSFAVAEPFRG